MNAAARRITSADILPAAQYAAERKARRAALMDLKRARRVEVGPLCTFYFESYETMWLQVHEMLHIEKGGEEQVAGELAAYNPLIPQGSELVATMMLEIEDPVRRADILRKLTNVEESVFLEIAGARLKASPDHDVERTAADGKTSSVHFLHFHFAPAAIAAFTAPGARVLLGIEHPNYAHMAVLQEETRAALARDFA
ncbi:MAG: DUF3501 family protein [Alphaproteobacteria bacterium]